MTQQPTKKPKGPRVEDYGPKPIDWFKPDPRNPRVHPEGSAHHIDASLERWNQTIPILTQANGLIIAGHWRWTRMKALGWREANKLVAKGWSRRDIADYIIADNQLATLSSFDEAKLKEMIEAMKDSGGNIDAGAMASMGLTQSAIDSLFAAPSTAVSGSLAAAFGVPPFTVLSARDGWWQDRKSLWIKTGIKSDLGRGAELIPKGKAYPRGRKPNATPGGNAMPSGNYSKDKKRGDSRGKPVE